jgi:WD40 repeat protein
VPAPGRNARQCSGKAGANPQPLPARRRRYAPYPVVSVVPREGYPARPFRSRATGWNDALRRLKRADLAAIKRAFPGYPYPDLLRATEVSVEALEGPDRERYLDLAAFPEGESIPEGPLRILWNLDEADTRDCMTRFVTRSLAGWVTGRTGELALLLHDLHRDFIHKRRETGLSGLHLRLVEAWGALPKLPDAYVWRWIAYHLVHAGRKDDLRRLLLDFDYLEAKLAATDANALMADYDYLADEEELRLIQSAIRRFANVLTRDKTQLAAQLAGQLASSKHVGIKQLLRQAATKLSVGWLSDRRGDWVAPGGPLMRTLEGHTGVVQAVTLTPDGRRAVSASADRTLRLWDLESGQALRTLEAHTGQFTAVAVTPDGRRAVSGSLDNAVEFGIWRDLTAHKSNKTPLYHSLGYCRRRRR